MAAAARSKPIAGSGQRSQAFMARSLSILAVLAIVAAFYVGKAVFLPLALAILLTFVLAPPVRKLRSWGAGRVPSVVIVVFFAFVTIGGIGTLVGQQVSD